ncbi:hypothetical protein HCH_01141 [Hahella chejuensis KCTC 2396]|uniref:Uncharacterized protein n=1 Tax=Hahella chejuensis (strain KCTC 2396) TaxID=349521 RepID=Q2SMV6_HAHCH|nr:hypothetical protein HCH_01141 [Hahella chejuensis KCTC 2396]
MRNRAEQAMRLSVVICKASSTDAGATMHLWPDCSALVKERYIEKSGC